MVVFASAQNPAPQAPKSGHFYWSARKAQELDYNRTIRNSPDLNPVERTALLKTVAALIRPFMADLEIDSERELQKIAADTRIELIDLNGDGIPEVIAQAFGIKAGCGATGNCPIWVFMKTANGYKLLFDTRKANEIGGELITVEENRTNGFKDLVFAAHDSASEKTLFVYRYRNGLYRESACYGANWLSTTNGEFQMLRQPVITKCNQR
jgi:hypothetical protein